MPSKGQTIRFLKPKYLLPILPGLVYHSMSSVECAETTAGGMVSFQFQKNGSPAFTPQGKISITYMISRVHVHVLSPLQLYISSKVPARECLAFVAQSYHQSKKRSRRPRSARTMLVHTSSSKNSLVLCDEIPASCVRCQSGTSDT